MTTRAFWRGLIDGMDHVGTVHEIRGERLISYGDDLEAFRAWDSGATIGEVLAWPLLLLSVMGVIVFLLVLPEK